MLANFTLLDRYVRLGDAEEDGAIRVETGRIDADGDQKGQDVDGADDEGIWVSAIAHSLVDEVAGSGSKEDDEQQEEDGVGSRIPDAEEGYAHASD